MSSQNKHIKTLSCPLCGTGRLLDVAAHVDMQRIVTYIPPHDKNAELFAKCPRCRKQIGYTVFAVPQYIRPIGLRTNPVTKL